MGPPLLHDVGFALFWLGVLGGGAAFCALLHRLGLPRTYVRDLLHVGAGSWVLGWPFWSGWVVPSLIPLIAASALRVLSGAPRTGVLGKFQDAISDHDERWSGIVLYACAVALLTPVGLLWTPFPAAAALLALALGDGLGGLIGRRWGRRKFQLPGSKPKSWEGAVAVALASAVAVGIAARLLGTSPSIPAIVLASVAAALAEAVAPRATDNLTVPFAVWAVLAVAG